MKIVITGGHFSPAYAVLKKFIKDEEILVIGRKYAFEGDKSETLEYKLCKKENIPFISIKTGRLQRSITRHTIPSIFRFPNGIYEVVKVLKRERPNVVLTFGGYIGLAVAVGAFILKIPVVLHEQTQKAGLSSRLISKFAKVVCISYKSSERFFKGKKVVFTGNPIREEIFDYKDMNISTANPIIYITGGSTGSHIINEIVFQIVEKLVENYTVVHQVGNASQYNDFEKLSEKKKSLDNKFRGRYIIKDFFEPYEVGWLLHNASLTVSRSGANTINELLAVGAVSLLIPLPHGQANEQLDNAMLFKEVGLGEYIEQKDLNPNILHRAISDMIDNKGNYIKNRKKAEEFMHKSASEKIIEQVLLYGRSSRQGFSNTKDSI